jgi:hypothetical protein
MKAENDDNDNWLVLDMGKEPIPGNEPKPWDARVFFGMIGGFIVAAYIAGFIGEFFGWI